MTLRDSLSGTFLEGCRRLDQCLEFVTAYYGAVITPEKARLISLLNKLR